MCLRNEVQTKDRNGRSESRVTCLEARVKHLEERLAMYEPSPAVSLDEMFNGPQRPLSPSEVEEETARLLAVCAEKGVMAGVPDVATCRPLLTSLAQACHDCGLTEAGHYLNYLEFPYD
jgi:hypothetical protein